MLLDQHCVHDRVSAGIIGLRRTMDSNMGQQRSVNARLAKPNAWRSAIHRLNDARGFAAKFMRMQLGAQEDRHAAGERPA